MIERTPIEGLPLGLVELDDSGTVLYYNTDREDSSAGQVPEFVGRDFFAEVIPPAHAGDLRKLVEEFWESRAPAHSRTVILEEGKARLPVRVLLARLRGEGPARRVKGSVLLHIRRAC